MKIVDINIVLIGFQYLFFVYYFYYEILILFYLNLISKKKLIFVCKV